MKRGERVDHARVTDGVRVEHLDKVNGDRPQRGTVIVRLDNTREVAWDGTTAYEVLTKELAGRLITI